MIRTPAASNLASSDRVVVVCRSPAPRALIEQLVPSARTFSSGVEAVLAAARDEPRAIVVCVEDVSPAEHDLVAALRRRLPRVPLYAVLQPEDEPRGRELLAEGVADFFVLPTDLARLPRVLFPPPAPERPAGAAPQPADAAHAKFFDVACKLSGLAMAEPQAALREGATLILGASGADRGCLFVWDAEHRQLAIAAKVGVPPESAAARFENERAIAERSLRTGETVFLETGGPGVNDMGVLLCIPVGESGATFGLLCLAGDGPAAGGLRGEREALVALAHALGRQYRAALQRDVLTRPARHEPETGPGGAR